MSEILSLENIFVKRRVENDTKCLKTIISNEFKKIQLFYSSKENTPFFINNQKFKQSPLKSLIC